MITYKNIVIAKTCGSRRLSGRKTYRLIAEQNISTTAVTVNISTQKNRVEISCIAEKDAEIPRVNQSLNKFISFVGESTPLQKAILLNVSEVFNPDYITASVEKCYDYRTDGG